MRKPLRAAALVLLVASVVACGKDGKSEPPTTVTTIETTTTEPPQTVLVTTTTTVNNGPPDGRVLPGEALAPGAEVELTSMAADHLESFWVGTDGAAWHSTWTGTDWLPPESLGGSLAPGLGAASPWDGTMELFGRTGDGTLLRNSFTTPGTWSGWFEVAGVRIDGGPDAWAPSRTAVEVVFRDPNTGALGVVRIDGLPGNGQTTVVPPTPPHIPVTPIQPAPTVCAGASAGQRAIYAVGDSGELLRTEVTDGGGWAPTGIRPASAVDCAAGGVLTHLDTGGVLVIRRGTTVDSFPGPRPSGPPSAAVAGNTVEVQWVDTAGTRRGATRTNNRWTL